MERKKTTGGESGVGEGGVHLTWEKLWVTASDGKGGSKGILQGLTGYAQPGEVLAIMGPSGCGKSTLLDTLAGRLSSNTKQYSGEILINGRKQQLALIWDFEYEPTSGLDSAASFHVMKRIVDIAREGGRTVIASIHQPSSEVFELFQNLCLLSAGKTVYLGPTSAANEFFSANGFPCPSMTNPSDHFLKTINRDFDQDGGAILSEKKGTQSSFFTQFMVLTALKYWSCRFQIGVHDMALDIPRIGMTCIRI
ncbi:hypothetical protein H6P81_011400 [Aristolochia fimbriata]|uniref:AAA+ ATPase domain-containing protein n=1 Tax=Aristolochia fimbriata TaxID=158543 RepID=A0AAV7ETM2_ARIFI|nr:hypothetical protein H6P81_011400 [Aristolochia fimbriata]